MSSELLETANIRKIQSLVLKAQQQKKSILFNSKDQNEGGKKVMNWFDCFVTQVDPRK